MESPLAKDRPNEAQEDSTSVESPVGNTTTSRIGSSSCVQLQQTLNEELDTLKICGNYQGYCRRCSAVGCGQGKPIVVAQNCRAHIVRIEPTVEMGLRSGRQQQQQQCENWQQPIRRNERSEETMLNSSQDQPRSCDTLEILERSFKFDRQTSREVVVERQKQGNSLEDRLRDPGVVVVSELSNVNIEKFEGTNEKAEKQRVAKETKVLLLLSPDHKDDCVEEIGAQRHRIMSRPQSSEKYVLGISEDSSESDQQRRDCLTAVFSSNVLIPPLRKRPANDFLPISATEVKRIGIEISEEEANQLRNEVRRLSPVLVSLRERTLGEISLTSDSGIFNENSVRSYSSRDSHFCEKSHARTPDGNSLDHPDDVESFPHPDKEKTPSDDDTERRRIYYDVSGIHRCSEDTDGTTVEGKKMMLLRGQMEGSGNVASTVNETGEGTTSQDGGTAVANKTGEEFPRCDEVGEIAAGDSSIRTATTTITTTTSHRFSETPFVDDSKIIIIDGRKMDEEFLTEKSKNLPGSTFAQKVERNVEYGPGNDALSQKSTTEQCKFSSKAVIEKLEENVEVVLTESSASSSCSSSFSEGEEDEEEEEEEVVVVVVEEAEEKDDEEEKEEFKASNILESSELTSGSRVVDVPGNLEDVGEITVTRAGSESATSVTRVVVVTSRCRDDRTMTVEEPLCQRDNDSSECEMISTGMTSRLSIARPLETFTEDSAESLTLAASGRDEVRSDGSDSGLGSEIPGDTGQPAAAAPESDSETFFLDRIPDDIIHSVKEKGTMQQLEETFASSCTNVPVLPRTLRNTNANLPSPPPKSNLKRRLTDCMENGPDAKRNNNCEMAKKKRSIHFDAVTVYYFPRAQGFTCVPSQGGSTLGMSATHTHAERFSLSEHAAEQRRIHRARLAQLRSERAANCVVEAASSSEDPSDDTDEEPSDNEELDIDSYYFLQPVPTWQRRALLRAAGVRRIDTVEKDECRDIRASREHCGCGCKGYCDPESCPCSRANVKCQVDRAGFPCGCTRDGCANSSGRIEFNPVRVRTHFIHTLMRLELEKKQCEQEDDGLDRRDVADDQTERGSLHDIGLGSIIDNDVSAENRINGGGFATLHYNSGGRNGGTSVGTTAGTGTGTGVGVGAGIGVGITVGLTTNCQPEIPGAREDGLDLYAIRDDCYPSEDPDDGSQQCEQRKLNHAEFSQNFQIQTNHSSNFRQTAYHDYQNYTSHHQPSTSRVQAQFQSQFQTVPSGNQGFSHYAYNNGQDNGSMQGSCQMQHPGQQHSSNFENPFVHDGGATSSQYTNLNPVPSVNSVVQQIGKLEPFSELLSGRYSYYGEVESQAHGTAYHAVGMKSGIGEHEKSQANEQQSEDTEECDENFGEIIKKSMVETVSA